MRDFNIKVPICPVARTLEFKRRLPHYRICADPRCQARAMAAADLGEKICTEFARQRAEKTSAIKAGHGVRK